MGLFDRLRGTDEEVEIRPPERERYGAGGEEDGEEDDDEFILPGMTSAATESSSSRSSSSRSTERSRGRRDDRVDRIIEQNERIIELLEDIAGSDRSRSGSSI